MGTWTEFAKAAPEMAALGLEQFGKFHIAYLATVRNDGSPRVHPVCPIIADGRMFVAVQGSEAPNPSPKRFDLLRDGRYAMHALPGKRDDEFYMTGRARLVEDDATRALVAETAQHEVRSDDWIFEFDIEHAMTAYWEKVGQPGTYAVRRLWHARGSLNTGKEET
jgi:hypothetical protein